MSISARDAAEVASRHGLNLSDAAALAQLADDVPHAKELAQRFARDDGHDDGPSVDDVLKKIGRI